MLQKKFCTVWSRALSTKTTPQLEYIYGCSSVLAALYARKRARIERLFLQKSSGATKKSKKDAFLIDTVIQLCRDQKITIVEVDKGHLNNLTLNRPHQGVVIETSQRDSIPIQHLSPVSSQGIYYGVQSNNIQHRFESSQRPPFWIALDEVQDPHNLGSILRTAHFFGVDGVIVCSKNSATLTPAVSKVSAGAMEVMDIYSTRNLSKFLQTSSGNGWHIMGADAQGESVYNMPLTSLPRLLVLGNEGVGLRPLIRKICKQLVSIPKQSSNTETFKGHVESLNVGVAAGVLISQFTAR